MWAKLHGHAWAYAYFLFLGLLASPFVAAFAASFIGVMAYPMIGFAAMIIAVLATMFTAVQFGALFLGVVGLACVYAGILHYPVPLPSSRLGMLLILAHGVFLCIYASVAAKADTAAWRERFHGQRIP